MSASGCRKHLDGYRVLYAGIYPVEPTRLCTLELELELEALRIIHCFRHNMKYHILFNIQHDS